MDEIVELFDEYVLSACTGRETEQAMLGTTGKQIISLYAIVMVGGILLYLICSSISYFLFFHLWKEHYYPPGDPQPFPGQVKKEIAMALRAIPIMSHLTVPFFYGEINGYSKLYDDFDSVPYIAWSILLFILWTDFAIYFIHRGLHEFKWVYKNIHKPHHLWKVPTPYASIAFHPLDGWIQSVPYHLFPYFIPMNKWISLGMFVFVQIWAVIIHDGAHMTPFSFVNGSAHHTFHHLKFNYNYGQYFTLWDTLCGTHMDPLYVYDTKTKTWGPSKFSFTSTANNSVDHFHNTEQHCGQMESANRQKRS